MAIAAPLVLALALLAAYIGYLILQRTLDAWLRPVLQWLFAPRQSFWKRVILWPVREVGKGLRAVLRYVAAILGGAFYLAGAALARYFNAARWLEELLTLGLVRMFETLWNGLVYLREVAIPKLIDLKTADIRAAATFAKLLAIDTAKTVTGIAQALAAGLAFLPGAVPFGIVARFAYWLDAFELLWRRVWQNIVPRLDNLTTNVIPKLTARVNDLYDDLYRTGRNSLPGMRTRLADLERGLSGILSNPLAWLAALLTSVAGIAMLTQVLAKVAPNLFCRNTKKALDPLCKMRFADFDDLFAFAVQVAIISNFTTYVRIAQGVTEATAGGIQELLEVT